MKRVAHEWSRSYRGLSLFRENLEAIIDIVTKETDQSKSSEAVSIRLDDFLLDNAAELGEIGAKKAGQLTIAIGGDRLLLHLGSDYASLEVKSPQDTKLMGIAGKVDGILARSQDARWAIFQFARTTLPQLALAGSGFLIFFVGIEYCSPWVGAILLGVGLGFMIAASFLGYYMRMKAARIALSYSHEIQSFFERNKDAILVNLIAGVVGAILGILGTLFVQRFIGE